MFTESTQSQFQSQQYFFVKITKLILNFIWKVNGTRKAKTTLKNNKLEDSQNDFKTCYKAVVIKAIWY